MKFKNLLQIQKIIEKLDSTDTYFEETIRVISHYIGIREKARFVNPPEANQTQTSLFPLDEDLLWKEDFEKILAILRSQHQEFDIGTEQKGSIVKITLQRKKGLNSKK